MQAHEDFVITVGEAYFLAYVMEHFAMNNIDDKPVHSAIPENIGFLHQKRRQEVFDTVMDEIVSELFMPFEEKVSTNLNLNTIGHDDAFRYLSLNVF